MSALSGSRKKLSRRSSVTGSNGRKISFRGEKPTVELYEFADSRYGRGPLLYTGPDEIRNHKVNFVEDHNIHVGIGDMSPERTTCLSMTLDRFVPGETQPYQRHRHNRPGEIGWNTTTFRDYLRENTENIHSRMTKFYQSSKASSAQQRAAGFVKLPAIGSGFVLANSSSVKRDLVPENLRAPWNSYEGLNKEYSDFYSTPTYCSKIKSQYLSGMVY